MRALPLAARPASADGMADVTAPAAWASSARRRTSRRLASTCAGTPVRPRPRASANGGA